MYVYAEGAAAGAAGSLGGLFLPLIAMGAFLYFFMIKPQKKRQQAVIEMRNSLRVGDRIVLYSGLVGEIVEIEEDGDDLILECQPDEVKLTFKKWAIREVLVEEDEEEEGNDDVEDEIEDDELGEDQD